MSFSFQQFLKLCIWAWISLDLPCFRFTQLGRFLAIVSADVLKHYTVSHPSMTPMTQPRNFFQSFFLLFGPDDLCWSVSFVIFSALLTLPSEAPQHCQMERRSPPSDSRLLQAPTCSLGSPWGLLHEKWRKGEGRDRWRLPHVL